MTGVIAIGALGGSGTRAIAQVLMDAGVYLGDNLNNANDNKLFTRLFKDPVFHSSADRETVRERLAVFEEYMRTDHLSWRSAKLLLHASFSNSLARNSFRFSSKALSKLFSTPRNRRIWGWKEPNTQIYLQEIDAFFDNLKYLHVIRHGLDMAFSNNKKQLINWGYRYGIHAEDDDSEQEIAYKQLEYWIQSTREVIEKGKQLRGDFLLVNHGEFCEGPEAQIDRMLDFIGMDIAPGKRKALYDIPRTPRTAGRYKEHDLGMFDAAQLDFVREMGFDV